MISNNFGAVIFHIAITIAVFMMSSSALNARENFTAQTFMQLAFLWLAVSAYILAGRYVLKNTKSVFKDLLSVSSVGILGAFIWFTTVGAAGMNPFLLFFGSLMSIDTLITFAPYNFIQWLQPELFGEFALYIAGPSILLWVGLLWRRHDSHTSLAHVTTIKLTKEEN